MIIKVKKKKLSFKLIFLVLKNIKFNVSEEGMIMAVTQNNDLEIYEYRGTTRKLYGFNGKLFYHSKIKF